MTWGSRVVRIAMAVGVVALLAMASGASWLEMPLRWLE
jgi:hypothetical protein